MNPAVRPAAITIGWSVVVYVVVAWQSVREEGISGGDGPDAADAIALVLMIVAALAVLLLVASIRVRARGLVVALWGLCGLSLVLGLALLVTALL